MSYDDNNIFAKILRGEVSAAKVYEDADTLSFMDAFPQSKGHTLVIPRLAKARDLLDCSAEVAATLIRVTQKIAKAVDKALKPDGVRIMQFNRSPAGQSVFHVHFHIMPVYEATPLKGHGAEMADKTELEDIAGKIRAAL